MKVTTDLIIGAGLVLTLVVSVILSTFGTSSVELQTTIASGLIGYLGRIAVEHVAKEKEDREHEENER